MSDLADMIADTSRRIFADLGSPQGIILAGDESWRGPLWQALEEAGLTRAWLAEDHGGAGLGASEAFEVLRVAGENAVAVPLAETMLAAHLLADAGLEVPDGMITLAPVRTVGGFAIDAQGRVSGAAEGVPMASFAGHILCLADGGSGSRVALVSGGTPGARIGHSSDGRECVGFDAARTDAHGELPHGVDVYRRLGAAMRAMQMAGAMQGLLEMAVEYTQGRVAFGRPISGFQAVQHLLARLAEETAAALAVASSAAYAIDTEALDGEAVFIEVAAAKIRAGEAAGEAALIAHQVHGAIGFTGEHPLHRLVHRLWDWRDDFGGEADWALPLGRLFAGKGAAGFWPAVTAI